MRLFTLKILQKIFHVFSTISFYFYHISQRTVYVSIVLIIFIRYVYYFRLPCYHFNIYDFVTVCMDDLASDDTKNYCKPSHNMLVVITSKVDYLAHRIRIRTTWANTHRINTSYTKVMFATGKYVKLMSIKINLDKRWKSNG